MCNIKSIAGWIATYVTFTVRGKVCKKYTVFMRIYTKMAIIFHQIPHYANLYSVQGLGIEHHTSSNFTLCKTALCKDLLYLSSL